MTHSTIDKIINKSSNLSWIADNTIYLSRAGSHSYGTNIASSDEDFRGICIPPKQYYFSPATRFEQAELKTPDPDTTIFGLNKFFQLSTACNPNALEILFVDPEDILYINDLGKILLDNREKFLSKKIKYSQAGYAMAQLHRIKLHRGWLLNPIKSPPTRASLGLPEQTLIPKDQLAAVSAAINKELDRFQFNFMDHLEEAHKIEIREIMSEMLGELKISSDQQWESAARKIGLSDNLIEVMQKERTYTSAKRQYNQYQKWKLERNPVRAAMEEKYGYDSKHAMHLVRLYRSCKEVLITGKLQVKRPDAEELIAIRNGAWTYDQLIEFAEKEDKELDVIYNTSNVLPNKPNTKYLDNLCIQLIEKSMAKYSWHRVKKQLNKIFEGR